MTTKLNGTTLTIVIELDPAGPPSSTGKTLIAASSKGFQAVEGSPYAVSLNVLKKR